MTTKKEIDTVAEYLEANGYDGLFNPEIECGCELADLCPCGEIFQDCQAGYSRPDSEGDFRIHPMKVSEECHTTHVQNCHICDDMDCVDNENKAEEKT